MADIHFVHSDQTYIKIVCERPYLGEIKDHFSFFVPNYKFHPKFRAGLWDGRISLINFRDRTILKGLLPDLIEWCGHSGYSYEIDPKIFEQMSTFQIDFDKTTEFYQKIGGPYELHDSQMDAFIHCVNNGRAVILAPTSNGKSYIIHGLSMFHALQKQRVLIVIDRAQLVEQIRENIRDEYFGGKLINVQTVYDDLPIENADVYITTWQSCYQQDAEWFQQFDVLIGDEVHKFKATSLKTIFDNCGHIATRYGFTATLDNDSKSDRLTVIGMFGAAHRVATTSELIEAGIIARPTVYALTLKYSDAFKRATLKEIGVKKPNGSLMFEFHSEVAFLESLDVRNKFISSLESKVKGNTLVAFKRADHGKAILETIRDNWNTQGKPIDGKLFFVNHTVDKIKRIEYSKLIDTLKDATAVVSLGTFATGVNIKNVNNIIVACQILSRITVPQLIGRGLRLSETKSTVDIYDLGDDLSMNGQDNASFKHYKERLQMYADEGFKIVLKEIQLA